VMGIVTAPHELVDADDVTGFGVVVIREADAHPDVLVEVLTRVFGQHMIGAIADLTGGSRVANATDDRIEPIEERWHPRTTGFGEDELEAGKSFEDAREDHLDQW